jgi:membrane protein implicated in regulation of membrane protease activity
LDQSSLWWITAGILVAVELSTGTFYLLMMAVGAAAGAVAAHLGWQQASQITLAAVVAGASTCGWHVLNVRRKANGRAPLGLQDDPDLPLDLGQTVQVAAWAEDGTTQVSYRGAVWSASMKSPASPATLKPGMYRIGAMQGNHLLLEKA